MTLEQLLTALREMRLILTFTRRGSLTLYAPGVDVPLSIRQAVRSHSRALQRLIDRSSIEVCPNPGVHRAEWDYRNRRYVCLACERLWEEVS
jgi:hypothetical protein